MYASNQGKDVSGQLL